jgi:CheY-like chemotaxis protein
MGNGVGEALTIAVVDDEAGVRALIRRVLERHFADRGIVVLEGGTGEDAVALRFGTPTPGLLIVNRLMPGMDGAEAIVEIRRREQAERLPRVPIIFASGSISDAPIVEADARLGWPRSPQGLVAVVDPLVPALGSGLSNRP